MAELENVDKGLCHPQLDCYSDEEKSSVFCWKAFEDRMSERLSAVRAQKLKTGTVEEVAPAVNLKQKII